MLFLKVKGTTNKNFKSDGLKLEGEEAVSGEE